MRWRARLAWAATALGAIAVAQPSAADADKERRIVLLDIEGTRTPQLRQQIGRLLTVESRVMSKDAYQREARRLRSQRLTPVNIRKVCQALSCDGIVDGTIVAEGGGYKLDLRLREGATGRLAKRFTIRLRSPRLTGEIADRLERSLKIAIRRLEPIGLAGRATARRDDFEEGIEDEQDFDGDRIATPRDRRARERDRRARQREERERRARESEEKRAREREERERRLALEKARREEREERARARERERERARTRRSARDDDFEEEDFDEAEDDFEEDGDDRRRRVALAGDDDDDLDDAAVKKGLDADREAQDPRTSPLIAAAGLSVASRRLDFSHRAGIDNPPPPYSAGMVPGIYLAGDLYPFGFDRESQGTLRGLGFGLVFDRVVKLESRSADGMTAIDTTKQKIGAGVRYRMNFGENLSIVASAGLSRLTFALKKEQAPGAIEVPNTEYTYIDPGVSGWIGFGGKLAFRAEVKTMLALGAGEIQEPEQYGTTTVTGLEADAGLEYEVAPGILVLGGVRVMVIGLAFRGNGALIDRNGDMDPDVGGARDLYTGGYLAVGYRY